jgi:hypothetical protein
MTDFLENARTLLEKEVARIARNRGYIDRDENILCRNRCFKIFRKYLKIAMSYHCKSCRDNLTKNLLRHYSFLN